MLQYVIETVQKVINSNYWPVYWKYYASTTQVSAF